MESLKKLVVVINSHFYAPLVLVGLNLILIARIWIVVFEYDATILNMYDNAVLYKPFMIEFGVTNPTFQIPIVFLGCLVLPGLKWIQFLLNLTFPVLSSLVVTILVYCKFCGVNWGFEVLDKWWMNVDENYQQEEKDEICKTIAELSEETKSRLSMDVVVCILRCLASFSPRHAVTAARVNLKCFHDYYIKNKYTEARVWDGWKRIQHNLTQTSISKHVGHNIYCRLQLHYKERNAKYKTKLYVIEIYGGGVRPANVDADAIPGVMFYATTFLVNKHTKTRAVILDARKDKQLTRIQLSKYVCKHNLMAYDELHYGVVHADSIIKLRIKGNGHHAFSNDDRYDPYILRGPGHGGESCYTISINLKSYWKWNNNSEKFLSQFTKKKKKNK